MVNHQIVFDIVFNDTVMAGQMSVCIHLFLYINVYSGISVKNVAVCMWLIKTDSCR